jgi:CRP-like cAMP-binding protein
MKEFAKFLQAYPTKTFQPGEIILHQHQKTEIAHVILSGLIKTYDINKEGEIKILTYDGPNEAFPAVCIFSLSDHTLFYFEAFLETKVSCVPIEDYIRFLQTNPQSLFSLYSSLIGRYIDAQRRIDSLSQLRAEEKILHGLDFLCRRFGRYSESTKVKFVIPISQQEMANFLGLTRETVSNTMNKIRKRGIVKYKGMHGIEVDITKIDEALDI